MLEELAVAKLLGKAMGIAAPVVIKRFTEEQIDILKRTLLNGAETEDKITLPQHYNAYVVGKFCEKEKSSLVSKEALSQESVYIDAYSVEHPETKILNTIDRWSSKDDYGVMLIHGEPGHGKTTLCRKAVYEHYLERFCKDKTNVFWFRLNPVYSDIIQDEKFVLKNAFCWGNIKSQRKMIPLEENEDAYRGSIIFLDGYDELKVQAQRIHMCLSDVIDEVRDYAEEYQIHFVITARTRSVEDELYELKYELEIPILRFAPMTEDQQTNWIHKRKELHEYEEKFVKLRDSSKEMEEMLGIPILFRMVVEAELEDTASGVVELYDKLFRATMERRKMKSGSREDWHKEYERLAYEIYCNDGTFADMQKKNIPEEFLYMFHLRGEGKQHVEFIHRSFYQYFLAHFLYQKMSAVKDEASAEAFLCCLAERQIDREVLNYIQQVQEKRMDVTQEKCEQIINRLEQTGTIIVQALKASNENGDAERHSLLRCEKILKNALTICYIIAAVAKSRFTISLCDKKNIHQAMKRYDCSNIRLKNVYLSGADLSRAYLSGVKLNEANLIDADLSEAYLRRADLSEAELNKASLIRANLIEAKLNKARLNGARLNEAKLNGAVLTGAKLVGANLTEANLSRANLSGSADLSGANLSGADLNGATLIEAILIDADLIGAKLRGARLIGAKLNGADVSGVDLKDTNLSEAILNGADVSGADLRWAENLDKCHCEQVDNWTGCKILLRDKDNLGLDDPDAHGIIWYNDGTGTPIEP